MEENQNIELKSSLSDIDSILKTMVALANNGGGEIVIGINEMGETIGITIGKNTIENFANTISKSIEPPILPEIHIEIREGKEVIRIKIKESAVKPHFYKGIAYKRIGRTNIRLTPQEIEDMIKSRIRISDFDDLVSNATFEDLDKEAFEKFKVLVSEQKRVDIAGLSDEEILRKLNLLEGKKLKNAAVLLFAKNPSRFFPFFSFKCAVSKTSEFDLEQLMDIQSLERPFFLLIDEIVDYIIRYIPKRIYLKELVRKEDPVIPKKVLREVVVNSLIHRDYEVPSPNYLLITPKFLEVRNPGGLPKELTIADLYRVHNSILRNDLFARVVYCSGYTDKWGSGTIKIIRECGKFAVIPEFKSERNFFSVTIPFKPSEDVLKLTGILKEKRMSSAEIARRMKIAERTARKVLSDLVEKGILKRVRKGNRIYYEV